MTAHKTIAHRYLCGALGISMYVCLPSVTAHAASLTFQEIGDTGASVILSDFPNLTAISATQTSAEGPNSLGVFDISFKYTSSTTPVPQAGSTSTTNYNIFEPTAPLTLSDTMHIVITWQTPTANDPTNVLVNFQFISDGENITPTLLIDAFNIVETGQVQTVNPPFGVSDLTLSFQSDLDPVPIPGALPLFATGLGALGLLGWHRKRKTI